MDRETKIMFLEVIIGTIFALCAILALISMFIT
jgi:hypothetical protein